MIPRLEDWQTRLDAVVRGALRRPFAWGQQDCASFALACVEAITGRDPGAQYRGNYDSALGATRILMRFGGMPGFVTSVMGSEPMSPRLACRGDLLLACRQTGPSLGICNGARGLFVGDLGLMGVPLRECEAAWRV